MILAKLLFLFRLEMSLALQCVSELLAVRDLWSRKLFLKVKLCDRYDVYLLFFISLYLLWRFYTSICSNNSDWCLVEMMYSWQFFAILPILVR